MGAGDCQPQLSGAVQLRREKSAGAGTDVTRHAVHAAVAAALVCNELGLHHRMAGLATERLRLGIFDSAETGDRDDPEVDERRRDENEDRSDRKSTRLNSSHL